MKAKIRVSLSTRLFLFVCGALPCLLASSPVLSYAQDDLNSSIQAPVEVVGSVDGEAGSCSIDSPVNSIVPSGGGVADPLQAEEAAAEHDDSFAALVDLGWYLKDGSWYYRLSDGSNRTGWLTVGGATYWLDPARDGACASGITEVDGALYRFDPARGLAMTRGLFSEGGRTYYADPASGRLASGWVFAEGEWYCFDAASGCAARTGWYEEGGRRYHLRADGVAARGDWAAVGGSWYRFDWSGAALTGWFWDGSEWYCLDGSGRMRTGWYEEGGRRYHFGASGAADRGEWAWIGSEWYCFDWSGAQRRGWYREGGDWFLLAGDDAHMARGPFFHEGRWSRFDYSGRWKGYASRSWVRASDGWYYADEGGYPASGWRWVGSEWYYLDPADNGRMKTGLYQVEGVDYYSLDDGTLVSGQWAVLPDGTERLAAYSGMLSSFYRSEGVLYSIESSSVLSGWVPFDGNRIYVDPETHKQRSGWTLVEGTWYFLGFGLGFPETGWIWDGAWYYCDEAGAMLIGWHRIDSCWYYLDPTCGGRMAQGETFDGSAWYYLEPGSGKMLIGWRYISPADKWCFFDPANGGARKDRDGLVGVKFCKFDPETGAMKPMTSPMGNRVAAEALRRDPYGYTSGWCQAWVCTAYEMAGASGDTRPCAWAAAQAWTVSKNRGGIPVGATVYAKSAYGSHGWSGGVYYPDYGHVGIYVGNGKVASLRKGVALESVESWTESPLWIGWGWNGGVPLV